MKTPISYYGGKQNLVNELLPLIPLHSQYVEPFCGGAALFWAKQPSDNEVLNDYDRRIINFLEVVKNNFLDLQERIQSTVHSEYLYYQAKDILNTPMADRVEFAWAFWVQTNMSFSNKVFGGFAFANDSSRAGQTHNKKLRFLQPFTNRLAYTEIFNRDAIELILMKDTPDTFMYLDPPYAESTCGHYENKKEVYYRLLEVLPSLRCKWLLSSYPSDELNNLRQIHGYKFKDIVQALSVSGNHNGGKTKTECLTYNYQLPQLKLFQ